MNDLHTCVICLGVRLCVVNCIGIGHICKDCLPHISSAQEALDAVNNSTTEKK